MSVRGKKILYDPVHNSISVDQLYRMTSVFVNFKAHIIHLFTYFSKNDITCTEMFFTCIEIDKYTCHVVELVY